MKDKMAACPKQRIEFFALTLIIILGFVGYSNSLNGNFIWDDEILVRGNVYIKDWSKITNIFTGDFGTSSFTKGLLYRPIQMVTYMLDYSFWGLNVKGYHFTNILVHILVALAVYGFVRVCFNNKMLSFLTGILFVVNPLHTGAVAYISGRADPLAALFILLCLIFYVKQVTLKNKNLYFLILFSYILALLSKEYSVITPMLFVVYSYAFGKKLLLKEFISILGISFIYFILRGIFIPAQAITTTTLVQRIPGCLVAIAEYLRLLLFPFNLHMEYGNKLFNFYDARAILGAAVSFLLLLFAFLKRKNNNLIFFSIVWFFVSLLPILNLYPINSYMAEHWLYLPALGFCLIFANALCYYLAKKKVRFLVIILIVSVVSFYLRLTIKQNNYWKNNLTFSMWNLQYVSDSSRLYGLACKTCMDIGDIEKAKIFCQKALEVDSKNASAYSILGAVFSIQGQYKQANVCFQRAISIDPTYMAPYINLGVNYVQMHNFIGAKKIWETGLKINPQCIELQNNLKKLSRDSGISAR